MSTKVNKKSLSIKDCVCVSICSRSVFRVRVNGDEMCLLPNDLVSVRPVSDGPFSCVIELLGVESFE